MMGMFDMFRKVVKDEPINEFLKNSDYIVYGARAMNQNLPMHLQRQTVDYDVYANKPRSSARRLERKLDKTFGGDYFFTRPAMHRGTFRVVDKGTDNKKNTRDDYPVADFTKPERKVSFVTINGVRYARLSERKKDIRKSLSDKASSFRHSKDKADLERIRYKEQINRVIR